MSNLSGAFCNFSWPSTKYGPDHECKFRKDQHPTYHQCTCGEKHEAEPWLRHNPTDGSEPDYSDSVGPINGSPMKVAADASEIRTFPTGATRDSSGGKPDYEGYLAPLVLQRFGEYMLEHQVQANGIIRSSDNWQRGMPRGVYLSSLLRHVIGTTTTPGLWALHRSRQDGKEIEDALCAIIFNAQGYLLELIRARTVKP
jgi:hypothetical protein